METQKMNQRGFSLVEALISLIVTTVLIGGATALFVQNQRVSAAQMALGTLHANLRFATNQITTDVRGLGMLSSATMNVAGVSRTIPLICCNNSGSMQSFGPSGTTFSSKYFPSYSSSSSDAIQIVQVDPVDGLYLVEQPSSVSAQLKVRNNGRLQTNDICMVTDANLSSGPSYDIFQVTATATADSGKNVTLTHGSSNWNGTGLSKIYSAGSQVLRFHCWLYYIQQPSDSGLNYPRLVRRDVDGTTEVMADFVEDIQVALGIDTNADNNIAAAEWVTTGMDSVTDAQLANLRAVRLTLTGRTPMVSAQMAGKNTGTSDSRYCRQGVEDRSAGDASTVPYFREAYQRIAMIRNLRPLPIN